MTRVSKATEHYMTIHYNKHTTGKTQPDVVEMNALTNLLAVTELNKKNVQITNMYM